MNNDKADYGSWTVLKYQDGVQVSAFKPKYALNMTLDRSELQVYLTYLVLLCSAFFLFNFIVAEGDVDTTFWLGFGIAFLNYSKLFRVVGIKTPEKTLIKARVVLEGNPEALSKAFRETHCELKDYVMQAAGEEETIEAKTLCTRIRIQQFLLTLQSTDLSPFWLGLSRLLNKISITNRGALEQNSGDQKGPKVTASQQGLSGSP